MKQKKSKSKQPLMKCFKQKGRNVESKNCVISLPRNFGLLLTGESKEIETENFCSSLANKKTKMYTYPNKTNCICLSH